MMKVSLGDLSSVWAAAATIEIAFFFFLFCRHAIQTMALYFFFLSSMSRLVRTVLVEWQHNATLRPWR